MRGFGFICASAIVTFLSILYEGYALSVLWKWYIVSHFGLLALTIPVAIGITLMLRLVTTQINLNDLKEALDNGNAANLLFSICMGAFKPTLFLVLGWIFI